jgi:very-short-patch-repair endonuclease
MSGKVLLNRARTLRREQTQQEHQLWQCLRAKRFANFKFKRQHPLGSYIADFICFKPRLIIELDGSQHAESRLYDADRDAWFYSQGFRVLRIWNNQWSLQRQVVLQMIWNELHKDPLSPSPSPTGGEGR